MKIIAVSGDGAGAGKTTAAQKFAQEIWSIAGAMRQELQFVYPGYDWNNKSQAYKETTRILEYGDGYEVMRTVLLEYGQQKCAESGPCYWIEKLCDKLQASLYIADGVVTIGIDDVRKVCEIEYLHKKFPGRVLHLHVANPFAVHEPLFDAAALKDRADYVIRWDSFADKD